MRIAAVALALLALLAAPVAGGRRQQQEPTASSEEIVRRILELRAEIENLLAELPEAERAALRRRLEEWHEDDDIPSVAPPPTAHAAPPPVATAAPPPADDSWRQRSPAAPGCNTLLSFDWDGDGSVSGADRYWRHLYLWVDENGDGSMAESEVRHLFYHDVRALSVDLDRYTGHEGISGDVDVDTSAIRLRLVSSKGDEDGVLVVDASGLARGGELELVDAEGTPLAGLQAFAPGQALRSNDEAVALDCP
jgi:hypothetical protein